MIAAPMPLLWRRTESVAALSQAGAKAMITSARIGSVDHGELAMHIAAEIFPMRHVCGFGRNLADGVIAFDDLMSAAPIDPVPDVAREGNPAAHVAVVTFDVTSEGPVAVARNHMELIVGGLAVMLEARLEREATILSPCPLDSFGSLAAGLLTWLLTGGTLGAAPAVRTGGVRGAKPERALRHHRAARPAGLAHGRCRDARRP